MTPAALAIFVFTVVTMNDESNGIAISWLFETKVSICGMSLLSAATLKYLLSGVNQLVL